MKTQNIKYRFNFLTLNFRKMEKRNVLKVLTTMAIAMIVGTGLYAQVPDANYAVYDANPDDNVFPEVDSMTVNDTAGYYVLPDSYFHPNYNAGGGWQITSGFTWSWSFDNALGAITPYYVAQGYNDSLYVQIEWSSTGTDTLRVTENAPAAYGGCSGDETRMVVRVLAEPTIAVHDDGVTAYIPRDTTICSGDALESFNVGVDLTGIPNWNIVWDLEIATLASDGVTKVAYYDLTQTSALGSQSYAVEHPYTDPDTASTATYDLDLPGSGFVTINDSSTVYTYRMLAANGRISRKSNYLINSTKTPGGFCYYDFTGTRRYGAAGIAAITPEDIIITVNPAPDTGPLYHIPNNWAE